MNRTRETIVRLHAELRGHLAAFGNRCRCMRWLGALFHVRVAEDILCDAGEALVTVSRAAYSAEQEDLEAAKILDAVIADPAIPVREASALRRARALVCCSAAQDRKISDETSD